MRRPRRNEGALENCMLIPRHCLCKISSALTASLRLRENLPGKLCGKHPLAYDAGRLRLATTRSRQAVMTPAVPIRLIPTMACAVGHWSNIIRLQNAANTR